MSTAVIAHLQRLRSGTAARARPRSNHGLAVRAIPGEGRRVRRLLRRARREPVGRRDCPLGSAGCDSCP